MPAAELPTIDFTPFIADAGVVVGHPPTAGQQQVAAAIDRACRDHGFLRLTNFGLSAADIHAAFDRSSELFALPDAAKANLATQTLDDNLGFQPVASETTGGGDRGADLKEAYEVGYPRVRQNDFRGCPTEFEPACEALCSKLNRAARRYCMACELALGVESGFFLSSFATFDLCTVKFLHYPPCAAPGGSAGTQDALRIAEHTDWGMFTFLLLGAEAMGLQIKPVDFDDFYGSKSERVRPGRLADDGWLDCQVPAEMPAGGAALVNTGALLSRWTNDTWRATAHRVIVPDACAARQDRYSIACFFDPDSDSTVRKTILFPRLISMKKHQITHTDRLGTNMRKVDQTRDICRCLCTLASCQLARIPNISQSRASGF
jgi:isopenicillin N synthase-like dioxygenase